MRAWLATLLLLIFVRVSLLIVLLVIVFVIIILEVGLVGVIKFLKRESLSGEPIDGSWNELLFDVLTELVVELETLLNIGGDLVLI